MLTQWGWRGSSKWREVVAEVRYAANEGVAERKTLVEVKGKIPTREEAEALIEDAGGMVDRVEDAHHPPNPHQYPHINYYIGDKKAKATIKIQSL